MSATTQPTPPAPPNGDFIHIDWHDIVPSPDNLRTQLTELDELANSIAEVGLLQPLTVMPRLYDTEAGETTPAGWDISDAPEFVLVAGHRRHAAIGLLIEQGRWPDRRPLPCWTPDHIDTMSDTDQRTIAMLVENLQRVDLDPIEEAGGYQRLVDKGWTNTRIGQATGRNADRVAGRIRLLDLPPKFQAKVSDGTLTLGLASKIAAAPAEVRDVLAEQKTTPNEAAVNQAARSHEIGLAKSLIARVIADRGFCDDQQSWQVSPRTHELVATVTPEGLADVLVPDDGRKIDILTATYRDPIEVTVWARNTKDDDSSPAAPAVDVAALEAWRARCREITAEYRAKINTFHAASDELVTEFAGVAVTKDVAASALWWIIALDTYDAQETASRRGWYTAPDLDDDDLAETAFLEWVRQPANLTRTVAALILSGTEQTPLRDAFNALVTDRLGPLPVRENDPPHPTDAFGTNGTNDDDDDQDET